MTKPIEGWVAIYNGEVATHYSNDIPYGEFTAVLIKKPENSSFEFRPVRITFTDEADVMQKRLEGETPSREVSRNDPNCCAESSTYEAVRKAKDLIEEWSEDNEFNRGLKAMADYIESIAPELNGYIELEAGQKIENALKKDRERILEDLMGIISTSGVATIEEIREIIFGEEK